MGKITKFTLVKEESQIRHIEQPISILMGRNIRNAPDRNIETEPKDKDEKGK